MREVRGLTLLELLVSLALFGFVAASGAAVVAAGVRVASAAKRWSEAEHHARAAVERVVVLLRAAGYGADQGLVVAGRSRVEFLADFSSDAPGPERHGFYLGSDGVLREVAGGATSPLTTEDGGFRVTAFDLAYFDREGRELGPPPLNAAQRQAVARVRVRAAFRFGGWQSAWRQLAVEKHVALRLVRE
ncbi:MAG: prepilin-type N-terminal cleavage/methylation domain-containing protein [Armatimonadota bacterium]|nr:prepilin-type N-terminal cleavage/methylation domain-containing protein [Armatimonadota bacterium]MDW8157039.1 prepilin-type N-terminal cleavage/methylation domain-containing protein [Armatimonadota bacterium]